MSEATTPTTLAPDTHGVPLLAARDLHKTYTIGRRSLDDVVTSLVVDA